MANINLDQFKEAELRAGTVRAAEKVPDADKLLRLEVDFGEDQPRQIISGIAEYAKAEDLVGRQLMFITNLEPRVIRGHMSSGMLLALGEGESFAFIVPSEKVPPGSRVR